MAISDTRDEDILSWVVLTNIALFGLMLFKLVKLQFGYRYRPYTKVDWRMLNLGAEWAEAEKRTAIETTYESINVKGNTMNSSKDQLSLPVSRNSSNDNVSEGNSQKSSRDWQADASCSISLRPPMELELTPVRNDDRDSVVVLSDAKHEEEKRTSVFVMNLADCTEHD